MRTIETQKVELLKDAQKTAKMRRMLFPCWILLPCSEVRGTQVLSLVRTELSSTVLAKRTEHRIILFSHMRIQV